MTTSLKQLCKKLLEKVDTCVKRHVNKRIRLQENNSIQYNTKILWSNILQHRTFQYAGLCSNVYNLVLYGNVCAYLHTHVNTNSHNAERQGKVLNQESQWIKPVIEHKRNSDHTWLGGGVQICKFKKISPRLMILSCCWHLTLHITLCCTSHRSHFVQPVEFSDSGLTPRWHQSVDSLHPERRLKTKQTTLSKRTH